MTENILARLLEHNNWANQQIIEVCYKLTAEQLDTQPRSVTKGTIRETLTHMVRSQQGYYNLLTLPQDKRPKISLAFEALQDSARASGEALLALVQNQAAYPWETRLKTSDGYSVEPWVVLVQIINHAHEHREQICSMLNALGVTPPNMDGWSFGEATGALGPMEP